MQSVKNAPVATTYFSHLALLIRRKVLTLHDICQNGIYHKQSIS